MKPTKIAKHLARTGAQAHTDSKAGVIADYAWIGWAAAFFGIEIPAVFNKGTDDTLSEKLRDLFHTRTKIGRTVWAIIWGLFAGMFALHIAGKDETEW